MGLRLVTNNDGHFGFEPIGVLHWQPQAAMDTSQERRIPETFVWMLLQQSFCSVRRAKTEALTKV